MFYGEYKHSLDKKGRIIVPSKFRQSLTDAFADRLMSTRGLEECIFLFPLPEWKNLEDKVRALPFMTAGSARSFARLLFSGASECIIDKQGRLLIPQGLRDYAHIKGEVIILGVSNHVEVWARQRWQRYLEKEEKSFEETSEKLMNFGI